MAVNCSDYFSLSGMARLMPTADNEYRFAVMSGISDLIDQEVFGHSLGRAIRLVRVLDDDTVDISVQVTDEQLLISVGVAVSSWVLADYTVGELATAVDDELDEVVAVPLGEFTWIQDQPAAHLSQVGPCVLEEPFDVAVLKSMSLVIEISGDDTPVIWLPLRARRVISVAEGGRVLAESDYFCKHGDGWIQKRGRGLWSHGYGNIVVVYEPILPTSYTKIAALANGWVKAAIIAGGLKMERIGDYSYMLGSVADGAWTMLGLIKSSLGNSYGLVVPPPE